MKESQALMKLIIQYLQLANKSLAIINELKTNYPLYINAVGDEVTDLPFSGEIANKEIKKYRFHGSGCRILYNNGIIIDFNFDFKIDGMSQIRGIDLWFLLVFIKSQKNDALKKFEDKAYVSNLMNKMVDEGVLFPPGSLQTHGYLNRVYYLKKDFQTLIQKKPWNK